MTSRPAAAAGRRYAAALAQVATRRSIWSPYQLLMARRWLIGPARGPAG